MLKSRHIESRHEEERQVAKQLINNAETKEHEAHPPYRYSSSAGLGTARQHKWSQQSERSQR